jgi:predicted nucleic acid-binding Zn ribbon protein
MKCLECEREYDYMKLITVTCSECSGELKRIISNDKCDNKNTI